MQKIRCAGIGCSLLLDVADEFGVEDSIALFVSVHATEEAKRANDCQDKEDGHPDESLRCNHGRKLRLCHLLCAH